MLYLIIFLGYPHIVTGVTCFINTFILFTYVKCVFNDLLMKLFYYYLNGQYAYSYELLNFHIFFSIVNVALYKYKVQMVSLTYQYMYVDTTNCNLMIELLCQKYCMSSIFLNVVRLLKH